ncbi:hypothetical protein NliqN6_0989 [Naganishia liquefaciens]|uniref:Dihydroorotate dehydrogenase (quinone), mitochondrial n=1 Tax=Naganishia liquefaciens TaxID=104408 RepID=A0A8H3TNZ4_9TREE|nr:hypothetical protein NliqN6_0989 [Naganishia liquefaciens]
MLHLARPLRTLPRGIATRAYITSRPSPTPRPRLPSALRTTLYAATTLALIAYYYDSRSALHEHVLMPAIRACTDAETSHKLAVELLSLGAWARPKDRGVDAESVRAEMWGKPVKNPVGVAAGFDKDARAIDGLFDLGFAYVEVGSITPEAQPGNPQPRFFRLEEDQACINRYGFNSLGHRHALHQLQARIRDFAHTHPSLFPSPLPLNPLPPAALPRSLRPGCLLAVNLGKNKTSPADSNADYLAGVRLLGPYADVLVINVSSPNTPGLRGLQGKDFLARLLSEVVAERDNLGVEEALKPKVMVKIAPDLDEQEIEDIAAAIRTSRVDGAIVSNTTVKRAGLDLQSSYASETGGLSGRPVKPLSLLALTTLRALLPTSTPLIGCGGISNAADALDFLDAGATLVQAYTAFGYTGVGFARQVKDGIAERLEDRGTTWREQVKLNQAKWVERGVGQVEAELKQEAERLRETLDSLSLIPLEDLAAQEGVDLAALSATRPDSEQVFGSMKAAARQQLQEAQDVPDAEATSVQRVLKPFMAAVQETVDRAPEPAPAHPALETPLPEPSWRDTVLQGDRRLV